MTTQELSLIRFNVTNFFAVILNSKPFQPVSTILIKLVTSLIDSEPEEDKETKKRIEWIYNNTHEKVKIPLSVIELAVYKNLDKGLNREIEVSNKDFLLIDLYKYLDEVSKELTKEVIKIAKKYSVDMPLLNAGLQKTTIEI